MIVTTDGSFAALIVGEAIPRELQIFFLRHPQFLRVSVGDHNWKDEEFKFVTLSKILIHPNHSPDDYLYDVAILTLSERIELSNKVSPREPLWRTVHR